jgi:hypothetical protein
MDLLGSQERVPGSLVALVRFRPRHLQGVSSKRRQSGEKYILTNPEYHSDLNHRKLTYDCHAPPATPFTVAIGPLGSEPGAPPVLSLRTIKSDIVVDIPGDVAERLDKEGEFRSGIQERDSTLTD